MTPERRNVSRYGSSLRIRGSVPAPDRARWFNGTVRDISSKGVYFLCERALDVGTQVRLMINLPVESGVKVFIDARATVLRVENRSELGTACSGIAAAIAQCDLVRHDRF